MFSLKQKQEISEKIQEILRDTDDPELPDGEIEFSIKISGREPWSWAEIFNKSHTWYRQIYLKKG